MLATTIAAGAATAAEVPDVVEVSSDQTIAVGGFVARDLAFLAKQRGGGYFGRAVPGLPEGADVKGYHRLSEKSFWLVLDRTVAFPAGDFVAEPRDVVELDAGTFDLLFDGSENDLPAGVEIDALSADPAGNLLLSFDNAVELDEITVEDEDVVRFDGESYSLVFDGSQAGVDPSLDLDGVHALRDGGYLLSFDGAGLSPVAFEDEDVLLYDPSSGSWTIVYDGSAEAPGWRGADLDAIFAENAAEPEPQGPAISQGGVVLATGTPVVSRLAPGSIGTVFGERFAPAGTFEAEPKLDAQGRVATILADTCLEVNGERSPIFAVLEKQINFQTPANAAVGLGEIQVVRGCDTDEEEISDPEPVSIEPLTPAFFNFTNNTAGNNPIAALFSGTADPVGAPGLIPGGRFRPARPGDIVAVFGTGFGATDPELETGEIPGRAATLEGEVVVAIGGGAVPASEVFYAGAAPCCAGLYQINFRIPATIAAGNQSVLVSINRVATPPGPYLTIAAGPSGASLK